MKTSTLPIRNLSHDPVFVIKEVEKRFEERTREVLDAVAQEVSQLRCRMYELEGRLRRYDQAFEKLFQEELDRRVNAKGRNAEPGGEAQVSAIERLHKRLDIDRLR